MFARQLARRIHTTTAVAAKAPAAAATGPLPELTLSFACPDRPLVRNKEVLRVTLPGRDGVIGIERNSPPFVTELRPGVVRVDYKDSTFEEYFVPGGFGFKHANNTMDVSAPEGVKLDLIDVDALKSANATAQKALAAAAAGSKEAAEAKIALELYTSLAQSLKVQL